MPPLYEVYLSAVGGDPECILYKPGVPYVTKLLNQYGLGVTEEQVQKGYEHEEWSGQHSFTWTEFRVFTIWQAMVSSASHELPDCALAEWERKEELTEVEVSNGSVPDGSASWGTRSRRESNLIPKAPEPATDSSSAATEREFCGHICKRPRK